MPWVYEVRTKKFYLNGQYQFSSEYAGEEGYKDDPQYECVKNKGALPRGKYIIGAPYGSAKIGRYTLPLLPDKSNNMCGRSEFRIHGESQRHKGRASEGCIVADPIFRQRIWASGDRELIVR